MGFSIFGSDSGHPEKPGHYSFQRNLPVVEQTLSYTRVATKDNQGQSYLRPSDAETAAKRPRHDFDDTSDASFKSSDLTHAPAALNAGEGNPNINSLGVPSDSGRIDASGHKAETDEDARFLRLAREALVATSAESNLMVDPTIQDLLERLQYALSPHGNPIRRSESIRANENGQLMIQNFYNGFPNLSNNVFTGTPRNVTSPKDNDWDFLMGKQPQAESSDSESELDSQKAGQRKFPCLECSMSFRRSSDLKRHEKQHLSVPANICPQCGKGFARKDALKRHLGTLTCKRNAEKQLYLKNLKYLNE